MLNLQLPKERPLRSVHQLLYPKGYLFQHLNKDTLRSRHHLKSFLQFQFSNRPYTHRHKARYLSPRKAQRHLEQKMSLLEIEKSNRGKQKISLFYKGNPLLVCKKSFSASRGKKIIVIPK